jgi:hypothetical protein
MYDVFLCHSEKDLDTVLEIARGLEGAGYTTWYYERDNVPGESYLIQVGRAIEGSRCVVLLISRNSLSSNQVTSEVVRAYEGGIPIVPLLLGISHRDVQERQQVWRQALVTSTSLLIPPGGIRAVLPRVLRGIKNLGISPTAGRLAGPEKHRDAVPPSPKRSPWRWWLPAGAVTLIAILMTSQALQRRSPRATLDANRDIEESPRREAPSPVAIDSTGQALAADSGAGTPKALPLPTRTEDRGTSVPGEGGDFPNRQAQVHAHPRAPADLLLLVSDSTGRTREVLANLFRDQGLRVIGADGIEPGLRPQADLALGGDDGAALGLARGLHARAALIARSRTSEIVERYGFFSVRAEIDLHLVDGESGQRIGSWRSSQKKVRPSRELAAADALEGVAADAAKQIGTLRIGRTVPTN